MFTHREAIAIRAYRAANRKRVRHWVAPVIAVAALFAVDFMRAYLTGGWPIVVTERVVVSTFG